MVDAHDYFPGRAPFDARQEELTHARDRFAYLQVEQYGGLNVGDFSILRPEQTWLASNIASVLQVGTPRPSRRYK
jgi:hypothetical protein